MCKSIMIMGARYKIKYLKDGSHLTQEGKCAECDYINKKIEIVKEGYPEEWLEDPLVHEIAHAFLYETGQSDLNDERHAELLSKFALFIKLLLNEEKI